MEKREAQPLDPWIIEEIRKRERQQAEEEERRREQPTVPMYEDPPVDPDEPPGSDRDDKDRGVIIIEPEENSQ